MEEKHMKLLKIVANSFKLCEDNFTISFVPSANKTEEDKEFELNEINENLYVYSTIGIVGKNASGKTTAVELLALVYEMLSFFRVKNTYLIDIIDKKLNLDITFYHNKYIYRYIVDLLPSNTSAIPMPSRESSFCSFSPSALRMCDSAVCSSATDSMRSVIA